MKTEIWNGHKIRFVENNGEWWAVGKDVAQALGYKHTAHMFRMIDGADKDVHKVDTTSDKARCPKTQEMLVITEFGIYDAVFNSHKPEAKDFKRWVFKVLKELRRSTGLEGFQIFRMLDKEHQKEMMGKLNQGLQNPVRVDFIKANTIANKAVSTKHGYLKMVRKSDMTPDMLTERQEFLEDTVDLMKIKEKYGLNFSVSEEVYKFVHNRPNKTA